jgi:hypothetical protein
MNSNYLEEIARLTDNRFRYIAVDDRGRGAGSDGIGDWQRQCGGI